VGGGSKSARRRSFLRGRAQLKPGGPPTHVTNTRDAAAFSVTNSCAADRLVQRTQSHWLETRRAARSDCIGVAGVTAFGSANTRQAVRPALSGALGGRDRQRRLLGLLVGPGNTLGPLAAVPGTGPGAQQGRVRHALAPATAGLSAGAPSAAATSVSVPPWRRRGAVHARSSRQVILAA